MLLIVSDFLELLLAGYELDEPASTGTYGGVTGLTLLGTVLLLVGLVGFYIGQSQAANLLGLVGFLVCFLGNALVAGAVWEATSSCRGWHGGPPSFWTKGPWGG